MITFVINELSLYDMSFTNEEVRKKLHPINKKFVIWNDSCSVFLDALWRRCNDNTIQTFVHFKILSPSIVLLSTRI